MNALRMCALFQVLAATALAAPGDLDSTFGNGGLSVTEFGGESIGLDVAVLGDGSTLVAGGHWDGTSTGYHRALAVVRFDNNGNVDTTFGSQGLARAVVDSADAIIEGMAVQPDGKIVGAGFAEDRGVVVRFTPNGQPDSSFAQDGLAFLPSGIGYLESVAIQADGRIVVAGPGGGSTCLLARLLPNGSLDPGFEGSGVVVHPIGRCRSVALTTDGGIVAAIYGGSGFTVARFASDGSLDTSFGVGGTASVNIGAGVSLSEVVATQPDGRIVLGGFAQGVMAAARFNADGDLDTGFGDQGVVLTTVGGQMQDLVVDAAGRIVATGFGSDEVGGLDEARTVRFLANGSVDAGFGDAGLVAVQRGQALIGWAVAIRDDGRIVTAGYFEGAEPTEPVAAFFAARILASNCGDRIVDPDETCDDGNFLDGDCCSATCQVEPLPCVPLGICAAPEVADIAPLTAVNRTILRGSTIGGSSQVERWSTSGSFTLPLGRIVAPSSETVQITLSESDGGGGESLLLDAAIDPTDCPGGPCFAPQGSFQGGEKRSRFRLAASAPPIAGAEALRRGVFERVSAPPEHVRFGFGGGDFPFAMPSPVSGIRRVRQSVRVGDQCMTALLDCRPIIAGRFLRCGPATCGNGIKDRGEQCGEPGIGSCRPDRECDTCRCVPIR